MFLAAAEASSGDSNADTLNEKITEQGNKVRDLKAKKASKADIDSAVAELLALKNKFKEVTGKDWKPGMTPAPNAGDSKGDAINDQITEQGNKVRDLKGKKADKAEIDSAVAQLLALKNQYKEATGKDWKPGCHTAPSKKGKNRESSSRYLNFPARQPRGFVM